MEWKYTSENNSVEYIRIWSLNFYNEFFEYEDLQELLDGANKISKFILEGKIDA